MVLSLREGCSDCINGVTNFAWADSLTVAQPSGYPTTDVPYTDRLLGEDYVNLALEAVLQPYPRPELALAHPSYSILLSLPWSQIHAKGPLRLALTRLT